MADVLDRVKKLLALAGSPNVHEAAAAAAKAQALIAAHRLEGLLAAEAEAEVAIEERILESARRFRRWKAVLASGLARVNGCLAYTRARGRETELVVAGPAEALDAVQTLYEGLVPRLQWLSADHGGKRDKRWHDDFRVGAAATITARLRQSAEAEREQLDPAALVRVDPALTARRRAVEQHAERLKLGRGRGLRVDLDAYDAGQSAGETVTLDG